MSRTNVSVLIATALLGVLLFVVRQIADDAPVSELAIPVPKTPIKVESESATVSTESAESQNGGQPLRRIANAGDLIELLEARGLDGDSRVAATAEWLQERGFNGPNPLYGVDLAASPDAYFASLDDDTLKVMSEGGDAGATLTLALRESLEDPFAATDLYTLAAAQGSSLALLQLGSQRETFSDIALDDYAADPEFRKRLNRIARGNPELLLTDALAYATAAVRDAGEPIVDQRLVDWLDSLGDRLPERLHGRACEQGFGTYVALSMRRRELGIAPVNFTPPPVFLTVPDLEERLPCGETNSPVVSTLDLFGCLTEPVLDASGRDALVFICGMN